MANMAIWALRSLQEPSWEPLGGPWEAPGWPGPCIGPPGALPEGQNGHFGHFGQYGHLGSGSPLNWIGLWAPQSPYCQNGPF